MRNVILAILFGIQVIGFSQISLENTYEGSAGLSKIDATTFLFYNYDTTNSQCVIYNQEHEQTQSINIALEADQYLSSITYLSNHLFNLDDKLELIYTYSQWQLVDTTWYLYYNARIIDEDGSLLEEIPGAQYTTVTNTTNGSEMLSWIYDFALSSYPIETKVYHLPGNYSELDENKKSEEAKVWPNPCSQQIYLPVSGSHMQSLRVYNANGQVIADFDKKNQNDVIKFDVSHLTSGIYFYQSVDNKGVKSVFKFVVP